MKLKHISAVITTAISFSAFAAPVATVNGTAIDKSQVDEIIKNLEANKQAKDSPALRENIKNQLITREVIVQEAKRRGLDRDADFQKRLEIFRTDLLQEGLFADIVKKNPVSDSQARKVYDELVAKYKNTQEAIIQQIILPTESEANKALSVLQKNPNFAAVAQTYQQSGEEGKVSLKDLETSNPDLLNVVKNVKVGSLSPKPVQIGNTWVVFKIVSIRDMKIQPFNQLKPGIIGSLQQETVAKEVDNLRSKAKVQ